MSLDLRHLLHRSVDVRPPDLPDIDRLVTVGRQRVRRRRATLGSALAVLAVGAALVPTMLPGLGSTAPGPLAPMQPVGRVVHLSSAREATPQDVRLLDTFRSGNLDEANGTLLGPVIDGGRVVVEDGPHGIRNVSRWGLLDPVSGTTTWFPRLDVADGPGTFVGYDRRRLLMSSDLLTGRRLVLWSLDRASGRWTRISVDLSPIDPQSQDPTMALHAGVLDRGRYWFEVQPLGKVYQGRLWSVSLSGAHRPRDEHLDVGTWDLEDGVLVSMSYDNRPTSQMRVRDLRTGSEHIVDTRSGRDCNQLGLHRIGPNVLLNQYCGTRGGRRDDRAQVVTLAGRPVVTLQDDDIDVAGSSDRYVAVVSHRDGHEGTFLWDLAKDRLLQLSHGASHFESRGNGNGDRVLWSTPILHGHGQKQWVGDLR
ncbi:MAG: hypothetical protein QOF53_1207 [Nocardioidaceae bacterium]|nr:hypothetical protein [Nocardioidaceae bacterium]